MPKTRLKPEPLPEAQALARARHGNAGADVAAAASELGKRAKGKRKNFTPEERQRRADLMRQKCQPKRHPHPKQDELNQCLNCTM
jgi:hypothetical protein